EVGELREEGVGDDHPGEQRPAPADRLPREGLAVAVRTLVLRVPAVPAAGVAHGDPQLVALRGGPELRGERPLQVGQGERATRDLALDAVRPLRRRHHALVSTSVDPWGPVYPP